MSALTFPHIYDLYHSQNLKCFFRADFNAKAQLENNTR